MLPSSGPGNAGVSDAGRSDPNGRGQVQRDSIDAAAPLDATPVASSVTLAHCSRATETQGVSNTMIEQDPLPQSIAPDSEDRIADFFDRHGGRGLAHARADDAELHNLGSWEVYAADGHTLRCEWSKEGTRTRMNFTEIPP
jgi:hypothetical protein